MRGWSWSLGIAALVGLLLAAVPEVASAAGRPGSAAAPTYYLALGDSLAAGYQPRDLGALEPCGYQYGYACDLYQGMLAAHPHLEAVNLSCPGETTSSMLSGVGSPCYSGGPPQLARAVRFLAQHRGQVALITIDFGANNVDGCVQSSGSISPSCLLQGLAQVEGQLPVILTALRGAAGSGVPIVGMNYHDPFLAAYLAGETSLAQESLTVTGTFNQLLEGVYQRAGDQVADVQSAFQTLNTATDSTTGLPVDVERICQLTWMCGYSPPNIHPNATGYQVIAEAFAQVPAVAGLIS
jgi:lysophospholipase L1-like esterase